MKRNFGPSFIIGFPRSGTTLLSILLGNHSKIFAHLLETFFFLEVINGKNINWDLNRKKLFKKLLMRIRGFHMNEYIMNLDSDDIENIVRGSKRVYSNIFLDLIEASAGRSGKDCPVLIERTALHCIAVKRILKVFPDAKFIYIVRDPRANVNSTMKHTFRGFSNNFHIILLYFIHIAKLTEEGIKTIPKGNLVTIRYEDLVKYPKETLKKISGFLGLGYEEEMLHPETSSAFSDIYEGRIPEHLRRCRGKISEDYINEWEKDLTKYQVRILEHFSAGIMETYGYQAEGPKVSPIDLTLFIIRIFPVFFTVKILQGLLLLKRGYLMPIRSCGHYCKTALRRIIGYQTAYNKKHNTTPSSLL